MTCRLIGSSVGAVFAVLLAGQGLAQNANNPAPTRTNGPPAPPQTTPQSADPSGEFTLVGLPVFKPAPRGAPEVRTSGGNRSANVSRAQLFVLAPESTGESMSTSPTLFWYVLKGVGGKVQVTVTQDDQPNPVLDVMLDAPANPGIYSLSLADRRVNLQRGVEYQWSVALITDPQRRERDVVASTRLICVDSPAGLQARLAAATLPQRVAILAEASLWYDALTVLANAIPAHPSAHLHRAALLDQVGLKDAAAFDRGR